MTKSQSLAGGLRSHPCPYLMLGSVTEVGQRLGTGAVGICDRSSPRIPQKTLCLCNAPRDSEVSADVLTGPGTELPVSRVCDK